jgi:hypothetical protein
MRTRILAGLCVLLSSSLINAAPGMRPDPKTVTPNLKTYNSPVYIVYTDVEEEDAKEVILRMTKMAYEYHERTKYLFAGQINQKMPFFLFSKYQDYLKASQMPGSGGVFTGDALMAAARRDDQGRIHYLTWQVVQHEGFHQFVYAVIRGQIPTWVNEGLAEYFANGIFTGDGMVTGLIPADRVKRVKEGIESGSYKSVKEMMNLSGQEWNAVMTDNAAARRNYDQAWSMVHFLAQGDKGKYQDAFARFLQLVGKGNQWEKAWIGAFGSVEGFEQLWKDYWMKMPENATIDLYAQAVVSTLTSFAGRSYSQKDGFDSFAEFIKHDAKDLKAAPADWLPPALYTEMKGLAEQLEMRGAKFSFLKGKGPLPQIVCLMEDGTKIVGTFTLNGNRIGKVTAEIVKPAEEKKPAKSGK